MDLQKWLEYGWLRLHKSSTKEISDLLRIVDRDLRDAAGEDVDELIEFVKDLQEEVLRWLRKCHSDLLPMDGRFIQ
jgi:hypothetical protein